TRSDVEVVVHGWEEWGIGVLERMNGMYAFALVDERGGGRAQVWLARDPAGVKPLYLGVAGDIWWFASELAAARECGLLGESLRAEAFDEYLIYRSVPSPGTFYETAWKVPPSHTCRVPIGEASRNIRFMPFTPPFGVATVPRN